MLKLFNQYFSSLNEQQFEKLSELELQIKSRNDKINVVSRKDVDNLFQRHILHSLILLKIIRFQPGTKILDAGTGGGFPGLPLAIALPDTSFHLVDSTRKKLDVITNITEQLALKNVTTEHARLEKLKGSYDFVLGRAVTNLPKFLSWTLKKISSNSQNDLPNGIFYWKGGELEPEISENHPDHAVFYLSDYIPEPSLEDKYIVYIPK